MKAVVPPALDGERADKIVAVLTGSSRGAARALCVSGGVKVSGVPVAPKDRLATGMEIEVGALAEEPVLAPEPVPFGVLYEDRDLIVVDKPPGLVVHPGAGHRHSTLASGLLHRYPELEGVGDPGRWGIVHRLDRDTSGVMVVARNVEAHTVLTKALAARRVARDYLTLVLGTFDVPTGTVDAPIGGDPARPARRAVSAGGKPARTHFSVARAWDPPGVSLLEVSLETGRTHQIRVHMAAIDHPVVGDKVYGRPGPVETPRIFLHACRLTLVHPRTGAQLVVESPLPPDLQAVVDALG